MLEPSTVDAEVARAGEILRRGGLVAFPTETVYGIAVNAELPEAVERLYAIKQRPRNKPMTLMVADLAPVHARCPNIPPKASQLVRRFWPGPLTIVMPDANGDLAGFRLPSHPLARGLVRAAGVPLYVPSANISDREPPTTAAGVLEHFPTEIDLVIDGGPTGRSVSSSVVQVIDDEVTVLREGAIAEWRLRSPRWASILFVCRGNTDRSPLAAALLARNLAKQLSTTPDELAALGYSIQSAGIAAKEGEPASRSVRKLAQTEFDPPLEVAKHRARSLTSEMVQTASWIFCMERDIREQILAFFPHRERDVLLVDPEGDVPDPYGQQYSIYQRLAGRLDTATQLISGHLTR